MASIFVIFDVSLLPPPRLIITHRKLNSNTLLIGVFPKNLIADIADKIIDYAKIGVGKAGQLYLINNIDGEARNAEARRFVYDALNVAGIERSAAVDKIVAGAIEAAVLTLGHAPKPPGAAGFDADACEDYGGGVEE
jgi:hypothetical protein